MRKNIETTMRSKGLRMTTARRRILEILEKYQKPMTALDIEHEFAKGDVPDRATVYRQLRTLTNEDIIVRTDATGRAEHYELNRGHHHHFVCNRCEDSTCLDEFLSERFVQAIATKLEKQKFLISSHSITFSGLCNLCHNKK